jgi:hypothetical protein
MNGPEMTPRGPELSESILAELDGVTVSIELPLAVEPIPPRVGSTPHAEKPAISLPVNPTPPPDLLAFMGQNKLDVTGMTKNDVRPAA